MGNEATENSSSDAVTLWLVTNMGGVTGTFFSAWFLNAKILDATAVAAIVGMCAAVSSLPIIFLTYLYLGRLLAIPQYWPRVGWTVAAISGFFTLAMITAAVFTRELAIIALEFGGWTYLLAALSGTALVYRRTLFRPDTDAIQDGQA
jgi:hypothetical protein